MSRSTCHYRRTTYPRRSDVVDWKYFANAPPVDRNSCVVNPGELLRARLKTRRRSSEVFRSLCHPFTLHISCQCLLWWLLFFSFVSRRFKIPACTWFLFRPQTWQRAHVQSAKTFAEFRDYILISRYHSITSSQFDVSCFLRTLRSPSRYMEHPLVMVVLFKIKKPCIPVLER